MTVNGSVEHEALRKAAAHLYLQSPEVQRGVGFENLSFETQGKYMDRAAGVVLAYESALEAARARQGA